MQSDRQRFDIYLYHKHPDLTSNRRQNLVKNMHKLQDSNKYLVGFNSWLCQSGNREMHPVKQRRVNTEVLGIPKRKYINLEEVRRSLRKFNINNYNNG